MSDLLEPTPYKGPRSYSIEDRALFFGREDDAAAIRTLVLGNRLSAIHAPSGAGKTSMLQTNIVPALSDEGFIVAMCRPSSTPSATAQEALRDALFPAPEVEEQAILEMERMLRPPDWPDTPLRDLGGYFRKVQPYDARLHHLLNRKGNGASMIVQSLYLRTAWTQLHDYTIRLGMLAGRGKLEELLGPDGLDKEATVADYLRFVTDADIRKAHARTISSLSPSESDENGEPLAQFVHRALARLPDLVRPIRFVLIIDQFEQFFTQFEDRDSLRARTRMQSAGAVAETGGSYTVRDDFFAQLGDLVRPPDEANSSATTMLPIRVVVSLRDDYVASLSLLEGQCGTLARSQMHHVDLLSPASLDMVIRRPARIFGYGYDDDVFEEIRDTLVEENRFVEPGQVQIVCDRLWRDWGEDIFKRQRADAGEGADLAQVYDPAVPAVRIGRDALNTVNGVAGIMETYFRDFVRDIDTQQEQAEMIDLLSLLSTTQGTRNIVTEATLLDRKFFDRNKRVETLAKLVDASILRKESHRGGKLVEVTHEFLLKPIIEQTALLRKEQPLWDRLCQAIRKLEAVNVNIPPVDAVLDSVERDALMWFGNRLDKDIMANSLAEFLLYETILGEDADRTDDPKRFIAHCQYWRRQIGAKPDEPANPADLEARALDNRLTTHDLAGLRMRQSGDAPISGPALAAILITIVETIPPHLAERALEALKSHVDQ